MVLQTDAGSGVTSLLAEKIRKCSCNCNGIIHDMCQLFIRTIGFFVFYAMSSAFTELSNTFVLLVRYQINHSSVIATGLARYEGKLFNPPVFKEISLVRVRSWGDNVAMSNIYCYCYGILGRNLNCIHGLNFNLRRLVWNLLCSNWSDNRIPLVSL